MTCKRKNKPFKPRSLLSKNENATSVLIKEQIAQCKHVQNIPFLVWTIWILLGPAISGSVQWFLEDNPLKLKLFGFWMKYT